MSIALALFSTHDHARACDVSLPRALEIVANPADATAPSTAVVTVARVERGDGHTGDGCGPANNSGSCEGNEFVMLQVSATDDTTAAGDLGYLIEGVERNLPPLVADGSGQIMLLLASDDTGEDDLRLDLRVFTVDKAGNMSTEPALVSVRDEGDGCQLASGAASGAVWSAAMLTLLLARRRLHWGRPH